MAFLYNKSIRKLILSILILWSVASFWFLNSSMPIKIAIVVISLACLICTWLESAPIFLLIFLSFTSSFALYGFLYQLNLPTWLIMIAILLIFGYLFTYTEQKIGILGNKRLTYLILFSLIILEVFLALSFFLISPLAQSMVIAIISYLFVGYCYTILARHQDNKFTTYLIISIIAVGVILVSSNWAGN